MEPFRTLGIKETKDIRVIKKAYSKLLSKYSPENNPEGFKILRCAYEEALEIANKKEKEEVSPIDLLMKEFEDIYNDFDKRIDVEVWSDFLDRDICWRIDTSKEVSYRVLRFLMDRYNLPYEVWKVFDSTFSWTSTKKNLYESFPKNFVDFIIYKTSNKGRFSYDHVRNCIKGKEDEFISEFNKVCSAIDDFDLYSAKVSMERANKLCEDHPELQILKGRILILTLDYIKAEKIFTEIINKNNRNIDAYYYRGELYYLQGKVKESYNDNKIVLDLKEDSLGALYCVGKCCLILKKYDEAIECFEKAFNIYQYRNDIKVLLNSCYNFAIEEINLKENNNYEESIKLAGYYLKVNKIEESYEILKGLIEKENFNAEGYLLYCQSLIKLKDVELAYIKVCKGVELFQNNYRLRLLKADILDELGKEEDSIIEYDNVILLKEDSVAYNNKAFVLNKLEKYNEALECASKAIELDENMAHGYKNKAEALLGLQLFEDCLNSCEDALNIYQYFEGVYVIKMKAFNNMNLYDEAIGVYNRASDLGLIDSNLYYEKSRACLALGKYDDGIKFADYAIELDDNNPDYYYIKGRCYQNKENFEDALRYYNEVIKRDRLYGLAYYYKVDILLEEEKYNEAIKIIDEAIVLNLEYIDNFYNYKGYILSHNNDYEGALINYKKALEYDNDYAGYYHSIGYTLNELGKYEEAIIYLKKAIELDPNQEKWYVNLSYSQYNMEQFYRCIESCNKSIELKYDYMISHKNKGWALYQIGKYAEAREECDIAFSLDNSDEDLLLLKIKILKKYGEYDEALRICEKVINKSNDDRFRLVYNEIIAVIRSKKKGLFKFLLK